jgi:hypothetical protein
MEFCEGCPIKDLAALDAQRIDRPRLLQTVTAAFAEQIFVCVYMCVGASGGGGEQRLSRVWARCEQ